MTVIGDAEFIRTTLERSARAVTRRPSLASKTATTRVRLKPGLECEIEEGAWTLTSGMSAVSGGTNAGPTPGVLGRGALGACLAFGYAMWAARLGVDILSLEVEVQADYDSRGQLGVDPDIPAGYTQVRYRVFIGSPAPDADVLRVIDTADRCSAYRDVFARAQSVQREVIVGAVEK